jgi:hypothetical protein
VSARNFRRVTKNEGLVAVEGAAPSETEKEIVHGVGTGNVGAPATRDSFAPSKRKKFGCWSEPELTGTLPGAARDERRKEGAVIADGE